MKKILLIILCVAPLVLKAESRNYYAIAYTTFGDYDYAGKTFYVISGNSSVSNNDLEFKYYADIIKQCMLFNKGIPTDDHENADFCILMDYALTDESYVETLSLPVWGQTGIASVTTTSKTSANVFGSSYGSASAYGYSMGNSAYGTANGSSFGSAYGSSTTTTTQNYNYNYGVTGYREASYKVTSYRRVLNLYAYDNKNREGEPIMLWKANAISDGASNDLYEVLPHMAYVMTFYFGEDSNGKKGTYIYENETEVVCMKKKLYLKDNVIISPENCDSDNGCESIFIRAVYLVENNTQVVLFGGKDEDGRNIKIPKSTYLIYNGESYPISSVNFQIFDVNKDNMLNKVIPLYDDRATLIRLHFPVTMKKGDTFDLVAYKDKKETKELFHFRNVILE